MNKLKEKLIHKYTNVFWKKLNFDWNFKELLKNIKIKLSIALYYVKMLKH